jgi:uncharacterized surface protein with fasciclin (FAS1) repeats
MNSFKNKYKNRAGWLCFGAAAALALTACSDFSDYNETPVMAEAAGDQTLWENISQNPELSDFASLVKQSGYYGRLDSARSMTVWAPKNGTFNLADFQSLSKDDLLKQFVKAHMADYTHAASGKVEERVHMLNDKSFDFVGDGSYTFGGVNISKANVPSNNGLLHIIDGYAPYYPSLYEYIKMASGIDSLRNHFMRYELTTLDLEKSVKGSMVDGVQTYIDSVFVTSNSMIRQLNASLTNEDSTYTFVMPTNKAFMDMYNKVKPYYNILATTTVQDVENYTSATDNKTKTVTVNASYLTDSLVRRHIVNNLVFSNKDAYNKWVVNEGEFTDTLRSTTRQKFSNPREILEAYQVGEPVEMSNGYARIVDSLAFYPWETYAPELEFTPLRNLGALFPAAALSSSYIITSSDGQPLTGLFGPETTLTEYRYAWITPGGDRAKPDFFVEMPGVMSTTYNFYVVFMPTAKFATDTRPNWLNFQLLYCGKDGKAATYNFNKAYADSLLTGGTLPADVTAVNANTAFINDPEKTDTVFIGRFTFPVNYSALGNGYEYAPSLRVTSPISVLNNTQLATYTRDVRIAAILLRPVELDEFEAKNK